MKLFYDDKTDLLYIRLDNRKQKLINKKITDEIVLDLGKDDKVVGIEILDASKRINLESLLPVQYEVSKKAG